MATTVRDPLIGSLVDGRYHVVRRIARGGMATVYLANDQRLDRDVALKVMHPHLAEGAQGAAFLSRFRREARAAARLAHPGLVGVFDQGLDGEASYLTMEYVDGINLRHRLHEDPPVTVAEAFGVAGSVLDALAAVHRQHLVHRDIKPENVLLSREGQVKVADFGLARAVTEVTAATTGTVMGTVAYLAPELIVSGSGDARSDVYAVGVMLYEMLAGHQPFVGATPIQVAMAHVNDVVPAPSQSAPWLPVEVDELVGSLTARDPDDRPGDATVALAELRRVRRLLPPDVAERAAVPSPPSGTESATTLDTVATGTSVAAGVADADADDTVATVRDGDATVALQAEPTRRLAAPGADPASALPGGPSATGPTDRRRRRRPLLLVAGAVLLALVLVLGVVWYQGAGPGAYTTVPTGLVGATSTDARTALVSAGLHGATTSAYSDTVPRGHVVSADPTSGSRIHKDGEVDLVVSQGVEHLTVPDRLVGRKATKATALLEKVGFTVRDPKRTYSDDVPSGVVVATDVPEGSSQPHTTTVQLTVSRGPAPVTVPDLHGMTTQEATARLDDDALHLEVTDKQHDVDVPKGQILSQQPEAGAEGHRTDTVSVVVSRGPRMVAVPDVVGSSEEAARSALEARGFDVRTNRYLGGLLDRVRFQDVDAGTKTPEGSTITITVW